MSSGESTLRYEVQEIEESHKARQTFIVKCYEEDATCEKTLLLAVAVLGAEVGGKVSFNK